MNSPGTLLPVLAFTTIEEARNRKRAEPGVSAWKVSRATGEPPALALNDPMSRETRPLRPDEVAVTAHCDLFTTDRTNETSDFG